MERPNIAPHKQSIKSSLKLDIALGLGKDEESVVSLLKDKSGFIHPSKGAQIFISMQREDVLPMINAQEICVAGNVPTTEFNWEEIRVPFKNTIFTQKEKGIYDRSCIELYELDYKTKEGYSIYCVKSREEKSHDLKEFVSIWPGVNNEDIRRKLAPLTEITRLVTTSAFLFVKEKLPRIFILTVTDQCKDCKHRVPSSYVAFQSDKANNFCLMTPNSCHRCPRNLRDASGDDASQAILSLAMMRIVGIMLTTLYRTPEKITKIAEKIRTAPRNSIKERLQEEEHFIEIKEGGYRYISDGSSRSSCGGSHGSPCEHLRREHKRHLKSGQVIKVAEGIVNKGHKKPIYLIKGRED